MKFDLFTCFLSCSLFIHQCFAAQRHPCILSGLEQSAQTLTEECDRQVAVQSWHDVLYFSPRKLRSLINLLTLINNTVQVAAPSPNISN